MSAIRPHRWSRAEVDRLVDERPGYTPRYELVDGELPAELPLVTGERYEPDLFVVPLADGRRPPTPLGITKPVMICETLSPGSSRHDRITKRHAFQRNGVGDYWIVDGDAEAFEVWHPADERPAIVDARLVWLPSGAPVTALRWRHSCPRRPRLAP